MGGEDSSNLGFQRKNPNSGMFAFSHPDKFVATSMGSTPNSIFGTDWDPLASLSQNVDLKVSSMDSHNSIAIPYNVGIMESQGTTNASHLMRHQSNSSLGDLPPKISSFGSGSFSTMVSSFGLSEYDQMAHALREGIINRNSTKVDDHSAMHQGDIPDDGGSGLSPNGMKRKRVAEYLSSIGQSQPDSIQHVETEQHKEFSQESTEGLIEQDEKKQKTGKNSGTNSRGKQTKKETSQNGESSKEDYIHVRARRGQATNSHSLAERVRREKISQRMRFLQDLVPGCNKITGKALMLDEIINYVQSLQRQVEFLSMKLATVNPDLNIDIDRILSKEVLISRGEGSALLGFGSGMSSSHQPNMTQHGPMQALQATNSHIPHFPQMQGTWDDELQNVLQMGFLSNSALESLGLNAGNMKVEL